MKRLLIDGKGQAVRTALMEDERLVEIFIDRKDKGSMVGYIINGVVKNILPSRFAFIDIGQEKNAFMNLPSDMGIKQNQHIPVQVRKDATDDKGANVSEVLKFKGKMVILYPCNNKEIGISKKITDKTERKRLHQLAAKLLPVGYGCVLRTQSKGGTEEAIAAEFDYLAALCAQVLDLAQYSPAPQILHRDNLILNDLLTEDIEEIILNDEEALLKFKETGIARLWNSEEDLFDVYGVNQQIKKALNRNTWLPCGGFVTFDQVEACVVIDVNTGKFSGKKNHRETILKTNLEAAKCIAQQIALRNLSGMIIVDFIDMPAKEDKDELLIAFESALNKDRIPSKIVGMTTLGLVQLTRRKQREPLNRLLQHICPHCGGSGRITTVKGPS